jgi:hypothetical protein
VYRRVGTRATKLMNLRDAKFPAARKASPGLNPADWLYKQAEPAADSQLSAFLDPAVDPGNYPKRVQLLRNLIDGKGVCAPSSSAEFTETPIKLGPVGHLFDGTCGVFASSSDKSQLCCHGLTGPVLRVTLQVRRSYGRDDEGGSN